MNKSIHILNGPNLNLQGCIVALEAMAPSSGQAPEGMPMAAAPPRTVDLARAVFLVGLIGAGISASCTPTRHVKEGNEQEPRYQTLSPGAEALSDLLLTAECMGFAGLNITPPRKQAVISPLHELSEDACALSVVNAMVLRDGRRIGHNTAWWGFAERFRCGLPDTGWRRGGGLPGGRNLATSHRRHAGRRPDAALFRTNTGAITIRATG